MLTSLILYIHFYDFIIMQPGGENSVNCIAGIVFHTLIIFSRDINTLPVSSHLCSPDSQLFPADQLSKVC